MSNTIYIETIKESYSKILVAGQVTNYGDNFISALSLVE